MNFAYLANLLKIKLNETITVTVVTVLELMLFNSIHLQCFHEYMELVLISAILYSCKGMSDKKGWAFSSSIGHSV